jgi:hypothetical protein
MTAMRRPIFQEKSGPSIERIDGCVRRAVKKAYPEAVYKQTAKDLFKNDYGGRNQREPPKGFTSFICPSAKPKKNARKKGHGGKTGKIGAEGEEYCSYQVGQSGAYAAPDRSEKESAEHKGHEGKANAHIPKVNRKKTTEYYRQSR